MTDPDLARQQIFHELREVAEQVGGTLHPYPAPRQPVRQLVLRELRTETDTQFEAAILDDDGTIYVVGEDSGTGVSAAFGSDIHSYEWVYSIPPHRVPRLIEALGGAPDEDVLVLLKGYYDRVNGRLHAFLCRPEVDADFSTWHS